MSAAETLRAAAALMRSRSDGADKPGWSYASRLSDPVVSAAVADWLWEAANHEEIHGDINCKKGCLHPTCRVADRALAVARAYLGSDQ